MRRVSLLFVLMVVAACGEDEESAAAAAAADSAASSSKTKGFQGPVIDLQAVVDTKLYGFRKVPERTTVTGRVAVGTYIASKKGKSGAHLLLEVTVGPCAGCTPTSEKKTWDLKTKHLLAAKRKIDSSSVLETEKVSWKGTEGIGMYSLLFDAKKRARGKIFQAEHAYAARFTDGYNLVEVKALPCNEKGHPFAKTREALVKATTKKDLKRTVRRAWAKLAKHFPTVGN